MPMTPNTAYLPNSIFLKQTKYLRAPARTLIYYNLDNNNYNTTNINNTSNDKIMIIIIL